MPRWRASSLAAGGDEREAAERRGSDKHEHGGSWGRLKIAQGEERSTEWWRHCRLQSGERGRGPGLFLAVLRMKCFAAGTVERRRERKGRQKKRSFYSWVPCSPPSNQTMAILGRAVFSESRLDCLLTLTPSPANYIPVWWACGGWKRKRKEHQRILLCRISSMGVSLLMCEMAGSRFQMKWICLVPK